MTTKVTILPWHRGHGQPIDHLREKKHTTGIDILK